MSCCVKDIVENLTALAPVDTAEEWDNCGLLVGDADATVDTVLVALDITPSVVDQAIKIGAQLIVSHHPVIFAPMRTFSAQSVPYRLAVNGISACCLHTCLDKAIGGVNDALAARLSLHGVTVAEDGYTRIGKLNEPMKTDAFIDLVENSLQTKARFHGTRIVSTVAVVGGSGGDFIGDLLGCADAIVTGEIKHHEWLAVQDSDCVVVEAGHFSTEHPVVEYLVTRLEQIDGLKVVAATERPPYVMR